MPLIIPNTIENDTPADATELQHNFATIQAYVNTNTVLRDGSVAMQQPLVLPGDPTQDNHAANKGYVDSHLTSGEADAIYLALAGGTVTGQIKGITPVAAEDLTRKDYVDAQIPTAATTWSSPFNGGVTVGNGTLVATYTKVGKIVACNVLFTLGSTSAITGDVTIDLPVTGVHFRFGGMAFFNDFSASAILVGSIGPSGSTIARLSATQVNTSYATRINLSSVVPFTWDTGDQISASMTYLAA